MRRKLRFSGVRANPKAPDRALLFTSSRTGAFALIEIIGVLAVIAVLAALLLPRVFEAISNARVNHTAVGINTVKTACASHFARVNCLAMDASVNPPVAIALDGADPKADEFDKVLLAEALLEQPFASKLGAGYIELAAGEDATTAPDGTNPAFSLSGDITVNNAAGNIVVEAVITDVALADARALNAVLDGAGLGEDRDGNDFRGRVKYAKPGTNNPNAAGNGNGKDNGNGKGKKKGRKHRGHVSATTVDVQVYITHR